MALSGIMIEAERGGCTPARPLTFTEIPAMADSIIPDIVEVWKPIVGWEGIYEVSDFGRVRRILAARSTRNGHVLSYDQIYSGYLRVFLSNKEHSKRYLVHRAVLDAFVGPDKSSEVDHINGNKADNRLVNLRWVTRRQNIDYSIASRPEGHWARGERSNSNKTITEDRVRIIRLERQLGRGDGYLSFYAKLWDVNPATLSRISRGLSWKHVKDYLPSLVEELGCR